ncbi:hypothetical protein M1M07_22685 [Rhodococcus sp. HM1]|uniref:hypothetical protein n=1 Tax=unclassified Rhodococcus (in: high G+C Gram-positive bacteria) TaxID=192944 RepID=UPI0018CD9414|nr:MULTISPECIES: hypothetical protein [unclassified Rhodococcus (in: high G+C Gram-positive bacteria)]MBH0121076.1 hypothetical protein [Rhodococcus sp. CX]MCK8673902.1 hypothetical protein [Rhodococcus sp. HM1]
MAAGPILRGATAGALTAALAIVAHAAAGGGLPTGPSAALLIAVAAAVGVAGAHLPAVPTAVFLAAGQAGTHIVLATVPAEHAHPSWLMLAAHAVAVAGCARLLTVAERLHAAITRVVHAVLSAGPVPVEAPARVVPVGAVRCVVEARPPPSIRRRGPPVAVA